jgi:serine-type D-Ala-D-Ala carboxypeptidase (penicillin-binding protein 5/6)
MKKIIILFLAVTLISPNLVSANTKEQTLAVSSPSAILINAENGDILFEKNTDKDYDIASLTKVMTMLIASEEINKGNLKKDELVTISHNAWTTGGSKMFLEVGTEHTVDELMKGIAIVSGNDASVALAEHISGTTDQFSDLMNEKAKELKMKNTAFYSPNGLGLGNDKHFDTSTAKDLALLSKHYLNTFPENLQIHSTTEYTTETRTHPITQKNNNALLSDYNGSTGLKTGMINGNYNLIATAKRGEANLIAVVLGSNNPTERNNDARRLLDYGFTQYTTISKGEVGELVTNVPVYKGKDIKKIDLVIGEPLNFIVHIDDESKITIEDTYPEHLIGGLKAGDEVGKRVVKVNDKTYEAKIVIEQDIEKSGFVKNFFDSIALNIVLG